MGRYRRKVMHAGHRPGNSAAKTKRKKKDLDQIQDDMKLQNVVKLLKGKRDEDLPGAGQFYCVHCARHFIDQFALNEHERGSKHRRRIKQLSVEAYTQRDADRAGGLGGSFVQPKRVTVPTRTQLLNEVNTTEQQQHQESTTETTTT